MAESNQGYSFSPTHMTEIQKPYNMMETAETHDTNPSLYEESKIMHHNNYNGMYDQAKSL